MTPAPPAATLTEFQAEVERHLKMSGPKRGRALADLGDLIAEFEGAGTQPEEALGSPAEYAAALDAEFGTTDAPRSLGQGAAGVLSGVGRRMAGTFNPADSRLLVPRAIGLGWDINMGAVAARLGLLRPDDIDAEVLDAATTEHADTARTMATVATGVGLAAAVAHHGTVMAQRGSRGRQGAGGRAVVGSYVVAAASAGLLAGSRDERIPSGTRLMMPALAGALSLISTGLSVQETVRPNGVWIVRAGVLGGLAANLALGYLPVKSALRAAWAREGVSVARQDGDL
ncbi:MAG: DUF5808 domain-containing protein [bacterium]|nr:DUF5808 domain-containing protein [bacterium]